MSLLNVPGFIKLFFPFQNVQTKYKSLHDIPVMTLDKQIQYIPNPKKDNQNIIFLHAKKVSDHKELLQKFVELKNKNYDVYLIPEQTPNENFAAIKQNSPKGMTTLGKMVINGQNQHPLIKFLKCNCQKLYNFKMLGAKAVNEEVGAFVKNSRNHVKYYKKRELNDFLDKQLGRVKTQQNPKLNTAK